MSSSWVMKINEPKIYRIRVHYANYNLGRCNYNFYNRNVIVSSLYNQVITIFTVNRYIYIYYHQNCTIINC